MQKEAPPVATLGKPLWENLPPIPQNFNTEQPTQRRHCSGSGRSTEETKIQPTQVAAGQFRPRTALPPALGAPTRLSKSRAALPNHTKRPISLP